MDLRVVAECVTAREALEVVRQEQADVMILDICMPGTSGVDALQATTARAPQLPVLILSGYPEEHSALPMLRRGRRST